MVSGVVAWGWYIINDFENERLLVEKNKETTQIINQERTAEE